MAALLEKRAQLPTTSALHLSFCSPADPTDRLVLHAKPSRIKKPKATPRVQPRPQAPAPPPARQFLLPSGSAEAPPTAAKPSLRRDTPGLSQWPESQGTLPLTSGLIGDSRTYSSREVRLKLPPPSWRWETGDGCDPSANANNKTGTLVTLSEALITLTVDQSYRSSEGVKPIAAILIAASTARWGGRSEVTEDRKDGAVLFRLRLQEPIRQGQARFFPQNF
ncbi:THAP domain-containing protein 1 isoform X2 [Hippopotamus amphibius kiboko]|uniref:THAP domain-containing protein 1 isoform X2 n=1 Tax=Hippopotamus amphibius kiboko TaxID=575201 RepID=UPI002599045D|nr:THAP domain-containing protein 1 isoform X2 [Hippopotamus amphibius kiboko]